MGAVRKSSEEKHERSKAGIREETNGTGVVKGTGQGPGKRITQNLSQGKTSTRG